MLARQMQKNGTAASINARVAVVIDLDDEIVEMIIALEPISARSGVPVHRPVVVAALRGFTPRIGRVRSPGRPESGGAGGAGQPPPKVAPPESAPPRSP